MRRKVRRSIHDGRRKRGINGMILEKQIDGMSLRVFETRQEMGKAAAAEAVKAMERLLAERDVINVIFAAAPSQNEVLAALAESEVDFSRVRAFHMDEYLGLSQEAPQRFAKYLDDHIFGLVSFKEVHYMCKRANEDQNAPEKRTAEEECLRYSKLLRRFPPDITLMGIGENGHIAFNDPHVARFDDDQLVKRVTLDEKCRSQQVHDGCFESLEKVPEEAVTLTIPALLSAETVICAVPGPTKMQAVTRTVLGPVSEECPATIMRRKRNSILFCDRESARELL